MSNLMDSDILCIDKWHSDLENKEWSAVCRDILKKIQKFLADGNSFS